MRNSRRANFGAILENHKILCIAFFFLHDGKKMKFQLSISLKYTQTSGAISRRHYYRPIMSISIIPFLSLPSITSIPIILLPFTPFSSPTPFVYPDNWGWHFIIALSLEGSFTYFRPFFCTCHLNEIVNISFLFDRIWFDLLRYFFVIRDCASIKGEYPTV